MEGNQGNEAPLKGHDAIYLRYAGQFIFWAVIMLVGWSFYTTINLDKAMAVLEQRVYTLEQNGK